MYIKENIFSVFLSFLATISLLFMLSFTGLFNGTDNEEYVMLKFDTAEIEDEVPEPAVLQPKKKEEIVKKIEEIVEVKPEKKEIPEEVPKEQPEPPKPQQPEEPQVTETTITSEIELPQQTTETLPAVEVAAVPQGSYTIGGTTVIPSKHEEPVKNTGTEKNYSETSVYTDEEIVDINTKGVEFRSISEFEPKYPEAAREFQIEATVAVKMVIGTDGKVESIEFLKSFEEFGFNDAVRNAVKHNRYYFRKNGKKVKGYYVKVYNFSVE